MQHIWGRLARLWPAGASTGSDGAGWSAADLPPSDPVQLGVEATRLLADPVLQLAFARIQTRLWETWRATGAGEQEAREAAYRLHWAMEEFRAELARMIAQAGRINQPR